MLSVWIWSYIVLVALYILNASWSVSRFMMPAFPAIALIWASGLEKFRKKWLLSLIFLIMIGFAFTSVVKINIAASEWSLYKADFKWAMENTDKSSIFMTGSQCISYHINRQTVGPKISNLKGAEYAFVNQDFRLDSRAAVENNLLQEIKNNGKLAYNNEKTKTRIYKINN